MRPDRLPLCEVFGPTVQGEGPHMGRRARFVRFGLCNLSCRWCDQPETWDHTRFDVAAECPPTLTAEIVAQATAVPADITVVSGGEPLIHQQNPAWPRLLTALRVAGQVHVETNGTVAPTDDTRNLVDHFTVSPKLGNAGDQLHRRIRSHTLAAFSRLAADDAAVFKFVATQPGDLDEVAHVVDVAATPNHAVWIMPEGATPHAVLTVGRHLVDPVLARGWNFSSRLHILLWGDEKGR